MIEEKISDLENQINSLKKNTNKELKFITFLGLSGLTILLSAFFLTLFGVVDLKYVNDIKINIFLEYIIDFILFMINMFFLFSICFKIFDKRIFKILLFYSIIYILSSIYTPFELFASFIIPISFITLYILYKKYELKSFFKRLLIILFIIITFQTIFGFVKYNNFSFNYVDRNVLVAIITSIDIYMFYYFMYKVVKKYVVLFSFEFSFLSEIKSIFKNESTSKESLDTSDLNARQKALFALMVMGYQLFQLLVVLAIGLVNNMFVELLVMLPLFWLGRMILRKSWHSDKLWLCSVATFSGFYILTKITPPFEISLFLIVALTGLFVYLLHILGVKADRLEELEEHFNPKEKLIKKLNDNNFKDLHIQIAVLYAIDKKTMQQVSDEIGYSLQHCKNKWGEITKVFPELKKNSKKGIDK